MKRKAVKKDWPKITETLYRAMLEIWHERQSVKYVADELELPYKFVKNIREKGVPELGLNAFPSIPNNGKGNKFPKNDENLEGISRTAECYIAKQEADQHVEAVKSKLETIKKNTKVMEQEANIGEAEQILDGSIAEIKNAEKRFEDEKSRVLAISQKSIALDSMKRSANEAALARNAMDNCLKMSAVMSYFTDEILKNIEKGEVELPKKLDARILMALANSNDRLTAAMERAIKIDRGKAGDPEDGLSAVGRLFVSCTVEELDLFLTKGVLPRSIKNLPSGGLD